jgi:hypothetical protein
MHREVADALDLTPATPFGASFYDQFQLEPVEAHGQVCTNVSCALYGAQAARGIRDELDAARADDRTARRPCARSNASAAAAGDDRGSTGTTRHSQPDDVPAIVAELTDDPGR